MILETNNVYKIQDFSGQVFYVRVIEQFPGWDFDYDTYRCRVLFPTEYRETYIIVVCSRWKISKPSRLEEALL